MDEIAVSHKDWVDAHNDGNNMATLCGILLGSMIVLLRQEEDEELKNSIIDHTMMRLHKDV